jgi:hypothetical protein
MINSSSNPDLAAHTAQLRQRAAADRRTSSSSPPLQKRRSLLSPQYAEEYLEDSLEDGFENGLGTWAGRQQVFSRVTLEEELLEQQRQQEEDFESGARHRGAVFGPNGRLPNGDTNDNGALHNNRSPEEGVQEAAVAPTIDSLHPRHLQQQQQQYNQQQQQQQPAQSFNEDDDIQAAWKWRFSRKWQKEQLRQLEGTTSMEPGDDDEWQTALDYMAAAAGGINLQFGRTTSLDQGESLDPNLSQSMSSLLLEASMSRGEVRLVYFSNKTKTVVFSCFFLNFIFSILLQSYPLGQDASGTLDQATTTPMASRRIAQAVRKAEQLMAHQQEIERQVAERWESTHDSSQQPWAAQSIPAVNIDSWGSFPFILARVMDFASGRQKLLIRGRNRFTIKQAGETLQQEVTAEALNRRLAVPKVDVLGSGKIEWSRDRDRCLIITGSAVHSALDTRLKRKEDVGRVAGALARTGLPALHTVIVADGGAQMAQNGGNRTNS